MPKRLRITSDDLQDVTQRAIWHLMYQADMSQNEIGRKIGYADGQMIGKLMRGEHMLAALPLANLSRLASHHGFDLLADSFSCPAKITVASTAGEATPNHSLLEENGEITMGAGLGLTAFSKCRLNRAEQQYRRIMGACFDAIAEIKAFDAARGDGAPALMPRMRTSI